MNHKRTAGKADQSGETEEAGSENGPIEGVSGTKEQRPTRKAALLQAAKELFGEYGYAETTFKKISERAGVALGLLTHHYGNKEKLFLACGLDVLNRFQEKLEAATEVFRGSHQQLARAGALLPLLGHEDVRRAGHHDQEVPGDPPHHHLRPGEGRGRWQRPRSGSPHYGHGHHLGHGRRQQNPGAHAL